MEEQQQPRWEITYTLAGSGFRPVRQVIEDDLSGRGEHTVSETLADLVKQRAYGVTVGYYAGQEQR